ncbi:MAG: DUF3822 family protein [Polaribacter sp.]
MKNTSTDKKLSIQFNLDGFSFCIQDKRTQKDIYFREYKFEETQPTPEHLLTKIEYIFKTDTHLQEDFSSMLVIHQNNLNTLVPNVFFDEQKLKSYLNFNIKTLATDFITFDGLEPIEAKNVYVPFVNINNYLFQNFGEFTYQHHISIFIKKLLQQVKTDAKTMYVNVSKTTMDVVVLENKKLLLANTFSYTSKEDFLYYILFIAEQLQLNTAAFLLYLSGEITLDSATHKILYQYIKNVYFMESKNDIFKSLQISEHTHFILLGL